MLCNTNALHQVYLANSAVHKITLGGYTPRSFAAAAICVPTWIIFYCNNPGFLCHTFSQQTTRMLVISWGQWVCQAEGAHQDRQSPCRPPLWGYLWSQYQELCSLGAGARTPKPTDRLQGVWKTQTPGVLWGIKTLHVAILLAWGVPAGKKAWVGRAFSRFKQRWLHPRRKAHSVRNSMIADQNEMPSSGSCCLICG